MQITHDDNSPVLRYVQVDPNSTWVHDSMQATMGDGALPYYFGGTMTRTTGEGNYMIFTFNGTAVYIYGSKRPNHGIYSVSLGGGDPLLQSGRGAAPGAFQALLYKKEDLDPAKEHTITVTNLPSRTDRAGYNERNLYLDIDYIAVETAESDKIYSTTIDDTSTYCNFVGGWGDVPPRMPARYYNTTAHVTSVKDDSVTCSFNGSSVQLFGSLYSDHGDYFVSLDGGRNIAHNGTYYTFAAQVPPSGLKDGPHTVTLTNAEAGKFLDLDYLIANSTIQPGTNPGSGTNVTSGDSSGAEKGEGSSMGAIIGGAVGGAVAALLLVLLAWLLWRRRNRKRGESGYMDKPPLDLTGDEIRPFRNSTTPPADGPARLTQRPSATSTNESMYGQHPPATAAPESMYGHVQDAISTPYLTDIPPPPSSSHASYTPSSENPRSPHVNPYAVGVHRPDRSTTFSQSEAGTFGPPPSNYPDPSPIAQSYKSLAAAVPFTARRPSTVTASDETATARSTSRMFIPGREMDAGPLSPTTQESHELEMLPPDYHQATEPLPGQRPPGAGL